MGSLYDGRSDVEIPEDLLKRICSRKGHKESQVRGIKFNKLLKYDFFAILSSHFENRNFF